jgi:hypothetical protein
MNPNLFAYTEFGTNSIHIKIGNFGYEVININYYSDEFYLFTEDEKFVLSRSDRKRYETQREIREHDFIEFDLELPTNFLNTIGMTNPQSNDSNYTIEIWKGANTLNIINGKVKYIEVKLSSDICIILKPIP